ncbi:MAG: hypothetical protein ACM3O3_03290 [Syntrophothermus sp.]
MKLVPLLIFLTFQVGFCQSHNLVAIKKIADVSDTTSYYYPYMNPFSDVFVISSNQSVKIELWSLREENNIQLQDTLLDEYKFNNMDAGKYLFLWDREKAINYHGHVLMILYFNDKRIKTLVFAKN